MKGRYQLMETVVVLIENHQKINAFQFQWKDKLKSVEN